MCQEYDPRVPDCGVQLTNLYLRNGLLNDAYSTVFDLIKLSKSSKMGVSHFKTWDCDLPMTVNKVQSYRIASNTTHFSTGELKYMVLLVSGRIFVIHKFNFNL